MSAGRERRPPEARGVTSRELELLSAFFPGEASPLEDFLAQGPGVDPAGIFTVSLTTIPSRLDTVFLSIESMLRQTRKARRIVLFLSPEEYCGSPPIPSSVALQRRRGLEIEYAPDLRSYKKIVPALLRYPGEPIVTIDDDCLYDPGLLERYESAHAEHPDEVLCQRARWMTLNPDGALTPYAEWPFVANDAPVKASPRVLGTGLGGILYPAGSLDPSASKADEFQSLCPFQDDIWLWAMALLNGRGQRYVDHPEPYIEDTESGGMALWAYNSRPWGGTSLTANDLALHRVLDRFGLYERLGARPAPGVEALAGV